MPAKAFIDTNVIIYALGSNSTKTALAAPLFAERFTISTQVLSETANVARKKLAMPLSEIGKLLAMLEVTCRVEIVTQATMHRALDISRRYGFSWFDSLISSPLPSKLDATRAIRKRFAAWAGARGQADCHQPVFSLSMSGNGRGRDPARGVDQQPLGNPSANVLWHELVLAKF